MEYEKKSLNCLICNYTGKFKTFRTQDYNRGAMMEFEYSICPSCGCMNIISIPENLDEYYGESYYSFSLRKKGKAKTALVQCFMRKRDIYEITHKGYIGKIMHYFIPRPAYGVIGEYINKSEAVLDVGCGDGYLLFLLKELGYKKLEGCDRFISKKMIGKESNEKIKFKSGTIEQCLGKYNLIMFHHSFEHMENPRETMMQAYRKLQRGGVLLISIPISGLNAFERFGKYWVQLDAPRHIFLHSTESMKILADELGFSIDKIIFDSSAFQYVGSIQYLRGRNGNYRKTLCGMLEYCLLAFLKYSQRAKKDNESKKGDQATFVFRKID